MGEKTELSELETEKIAAPAPGESTVVTEDAENLPAEDDKVPAVIGDAEVDDGGVRTNSAVEPVADVLATGAGAPKPPPENVNAEGREVFEDDVAPTARVDYDGPGAPAGQPTEESQGRDGGDTGGESESTPVPEDTSDSDPDELAEAHTAAELEAAASARDLATSGTKAEVAERIVEYDRDDS